MRPLSCVIKNATAAAAGLWFLLPRPVQGQDISHLVGDRDPFRLDRVFAFGAGDSAFGSSADIKGGLSYSLGVESSYNSNFFQAESHPDSELTTNISAPITYVSDPEGGAPLSFTATYAPVYVAYLNRSDLDRFNHSADASLVVQGSRTILSLVGGYHEVSGTDRLAGKFVTGALFNVGLQGQYELAPRTTVNAGTAYNTSYFANGSGVGSSNYNANVGAYWAASERLKFGPAFSYSAIKSDNIGSRDTWSAVAQADYQISEKIHVAGALGLQFAKNSRDSEGATPGLTGNLDAIYALNERWSWSGSVGYVTVSSPSVENYVVNDVTISTQLSRQLKIGAASAGLSYTISDYSSVGPVSQDIGKDRNSNIFLSYQRGFLHDRLAFSTSVAYSVDRGVTDWEQFLLSVGLQMQF